MSPSGRRQGRYSQAARVIVLLDMLRARRHGITMAELSEELGVTARQVRRDLAALSEAGYETATRLDGESARRIVLVRTPQGLVP